MSRLPEARLASLEATENPLAPELVHLLFLERGEAEPVGIARQFRGTPPFGRLLVVRWAETEAEAIADPAGGRP